MIARLEVSVFAPVAPTEVTDRVVDAVETIVPTATIEVRDDGVYATAHSLAEFSEHLHRREILDTARSQFYAGQGERGFSFTVKKQPALSGVVTFAVDEPAELGEIEVDVRVTEGSVDDVIDAIAPRTEDGVPVADS